jgi:hypothetical protein
MKIRCLMAVVLAAACTLLKPFHAGFVSKRACSSAGVVHAAQGGETYPYGGTRSGSYGEKRQVTSTEEARKILNAYFAKQKVKIGEIVEKELYYEAEILGQDNKMIDKVIINKRTGRIRSIF